MTDETKRNETTREKAQMVNLGEEHVLARRSDGECGHYRGPLPLSRQQSSTSHEVMAECELLTGNLLGADDRLLKLTQRAKSSHDMAVVTRLRLTVYTVLDRSDRGVEVCLEYLRRDGSTWPLHPTIEEVRFEYHRVWALVADLFSTQLQLIRMLRGLTGKFGSFNDEHFNELEFERHLASNPVLADAEFGYWALKVQARFLAGDYDSAIHASVKAHQLLWSAPSLLEPSAFRFYSAISYTAAWDCSSPDKKPQYLDAALDNYRQLEIWSENCPANFENRAALVGAEIARIEGRLLDAEELYEKAIRSAHANGFIHNEGVANEVAARFYAARSAR